MSESKHKRARHKRRPGRGSDVPGRLAARLRRLSRLRPELALVLGSGFQGVIDGVRVDAQISYPALSGFPQTRTAGHAGKVVIGTLGGVPVLILSGRPHYHEGCEPAELALPVRVLSAYGIRAVLFTNAAGGIRAGFRPGDFMIAKDHINFMGMNPLRDGPASGVNRFVDLSGAYDAGLRRLLRQTAPTAGIRAREGVYLAVSGPSYETPAEIRAFRLLGADAVGMSTVPEVLVARQCGMAVASVSCITNPAAGRNRTRLTHEGVLEQASRVKDRATRWLSAFAHWYGSERHGDRVRIRSRS